MSLTIPITLSGDQLEAIAEMVAVKLGKVSENPMTIAEFAKASGLSSSTVRRWVYAGIILKCPVPGDILIPVTELERYREGKGIPARATHPKK